MTELKKCPLCGGQTMLCQNSGVVYAYPDFSIICLDCGVEFKMHYNPQANAAVDTAEAAKSIIEKFNRRDEPKESQSKYFMRKQNETVERILKRIYKESFGVDLDNEAEAALTPTPASDVPEGE